jgi:hypothetical protein
MKNHSRTTVNIPHLPFPRRLNLSLIGIALIFSFLLSSCGGSNGPDLSGVQVREVQIARFDTAWFSLDSNNISSGLDRLDREYPYFLPDFLYNILGIPPSSDSNTIALKASRQFLVSYRTVEDSLAKKYPDLHWLEKELTEGFRYIKYYFPRYPLPQKVVAYTGPFDAPGVAITKYSLAIGLQSYAGGNFSFYLSGKGQDMYPIYISRRFEPQYITPNCITVLAQDIFPDSSDGRPMIEQMITRGRFWWLSGKLLPSTPDSIITGFTNAQLKWCNSNEVGVWNYFLQNTDLYTVDADIIKNYIGEGPKTLGMPDMSPGNIGTWVGWQIVKKYAQTHSGISPEALMRVPVRTIFDEAKYKPK